MWAFTAIIGYIVFCTTLRHNQKRAMEVKLNYRDMASLAKMTLKDAQEIQT